MGRREDIKPLPSLERLNELFVYDPESGDLRWKSIPKNFRRARVGDLVGTVSAKGYRVVGIDRGYYLVHRIIWKMVTGQDPADLIDHEDTNRLNNRWRNLREATNGPNICNSRLRKDNSSGVKGICWDRGHNAWRAYISAGHGQIKLGRFKDKRDAIAARMKAAEEMHGQFMRVA
jgi:hypothetical protein